jgi:outer membrane protein assembly factor BamD (BamD/ComL family)
MRKPTIRRMSVAATLALVLFAPFWAVQACGPDFGPDIFVRKDKPDDLAVFAGGHLGIVQAGFDSNEYAVAYRYLNGGQLSPAELASYAPQRAAGPRPLRDWREMTPQRIAEAREADKQAHLAAQPAGAWLLARTQYTAEPMPIPQEKAFPVDQDGNVNFDPSYINCPDAAFQNAVLTLTSRAGTWGKTSPWLAEWISGQDQVFANCVGGSGLSPAAALANSPALLRADRAYQIAAAAFYSRQFDRAIQLFDQIEQDKSSPWAPWAGYLAARAMVRKAFALGKKTEEYSDDLADYDATTMREAQHRLETLLAQPQPRSAPSREVLTRELNFIRIRTEPGNRLREICAALAGPAPDPNFALDLQDLNWALIKHLPAPDPPPLLAWIAAWRSPDAELAKAAWQRTHALPWLVVALARVDAADPIAADLLAEAAEIQPTSPAYDTVFYHRVRLLIAMHRMDEARSMLDHALPALPRGASSRRNALLGERMAVARTFQEFLQYAPRTILEEFSEGAGDRREQCTQGAHASSPSNACPASDPFQAFDDDSVWVLNSQIPLALLIQAAQSPALPPNLRQYVTLAAWTRSVALEDATSAAKLAPLLPASLREAAGTGVGFPACMAILRNPGLRPYVEAGVSRLSSYTELDNFRDNWWSQGWSTTFSDGKPVEKEPGSPSFLTAAQNAAAAQEYQRLKRQPEGAAFIGRRVIDYAKQHGDDPNVPEALALTVRATHYSTRDWSVDAKNADSEMKAVSKAAFQLLHSRYPKSPWTVKTPYYY